MVRVEFEFPVESDAHKARTSIFKFFDGSSFTEKKAFKLSKIKKDGDFTRPIWSFTVDISLNVPIDDDEIIEKYIKLSGGTLDIMNGAKQVWAFA